MAFFSVCSQLRAFAAHVVYVSRPDLRDGRPVLRSRTPVQALNLSRAVWDPVSRPEAQISALAVRSDSGAGAARSLALQENHIFERAGLRDQAYTLVLFPEAVERQGTTVLRRVPLVILRGVYAMRDNEAEALQGRVTRAEFRTPLGVRDS